MKAFAVFGALLLSSGLVACQDNRDYQVNEKLKACHELRSEELRAHCIESVK